MDLTWFIMIYFLKGGWLIALNYRVSPQLVCITFLYRSPPRPSRSRRLSLKWGQFCCAAMLLVEGCLSVLHLKWDRTCRWIGESVTTEWERCRGESNKWKIWCWSWHCDIRADFFRHIFCTGMCLYAILRVSQHHALSRRTLRGCLGDQKLGEPWNWIWLVVDLPLWKIWVRQWEGWHSIYYGK